MSSKEIYRLLDGITIADADMAPRQDLYEKYLELEERGLVQRIAMRSRTKFVATSKGSDALLYGLNSARVRNPAGTALGIAAAIGIAIGLVAARRVG